MKIDVILTLLSGFSLFLCLWIVLPAPIFSLLPLSVGTPEISPTLLIANLILTIIILFNCYLKPSTILYFSLSFIIIALIFSALPLSQLPSVKAKSDRDLNTFLNSINASIQSPLNAFSFQNLIQGIPPTNTRETLNIPFKDNLKLNVYRPPEAGINPAIVLIYGGAWQRGNPSQDKQFSRYMAQQGYSVWAISYRHAPAHTFPAQREDVQSALEFIKNHAHEYETDLNRIAIMGRSAGAQLAMLAAYNTAPFPIRALVNYYGPVNLTAGYYNLPTPDPIGSRSVLTTFLGGTPDEFPDRYKQASPINSVKPGLPPSLLIYGGRDHIVKSEFGQYLAKSLVEQNNAVLFIEIPWADHAFDSVFQGVSNQFALYYTDRFLAAILKSS